MRLFLASEAKNPTSIEKLEIFLDGFKGKSLAYIPTAANGEQPFGEWRESSGSWKLVNTLGFKVEAVQLEDYKNSSVVGQLHNKDVLWFAGGMPGYLMYWIRRCELDKTLPDLLESSVYVGSSAGSMITSKSIDTTEWYFGEGEPGAGIIPGLGLVDFDIFPHYEDHMLNDIKKYYKGKKMYLIKNGEEIVVKNGEIMVQGKERVIASKG